MIKIKKTPVKLKPMTSRHCGTLGLAVAWKPASHTRIPGMESCLCFCCSSWLLYTLGGSRGQFKYLFPYHSFWRPRWNSLFLTSTRPNPSIWEWICRWNTLHTPILVCLSLLPSMRLPHGVIGFSFLTQVALQGFSFQEGPRICISGNPVSSLEQYLNLIPEGG